MIKFYFLFFLFFLNCLCENKINLNEINSKFEKSNLIIFFEFSVNILIIFRILILQWNMIHYIQE